MKKPEGALAILRDVRFAIKSLRRTPGFTLIAIVTLGLGIGANTSMFSILNGYMLRPAPYADRDRLDRIYRATRQDSRGGISPADYLDLKSRMSGYGEIAAYASSDMSLSEPGKSAEMAVGLRTSANLFSTLGTSPSSAAPSAPTRRSWAATASSSSVTATGRVDSGVTVTSSAARSASTASPTRSSACCPPPSATGAI